MTCIRKQQFYTVYEMQEIPVYEGNYDLYQKATFLQSLRNTIHIRFNDTMIQNEAVMFLL